MTGARRRGGTNGGSSKNRVNNSGPSSSNNKVVLVEDAVDMTQFLQYLEADIKYNKTQPGNSAKETMDIVLECFQEFFTLEETTHKLEKYDIEPSATQEIYDGILNQMKEKVRKDYQWLSSQATYARKTTPPDLKQADTAKEFLQMFELQLQQNSDRSAQQKALLKCFQRYLSLQETTDEMLSHYSSMTASEVSTHYNGMMDQMNNNVRKEYLSLMCKGSQEVQVNQQVLTNAWGGSGESTSAHKGSQVPEEVQENQQVPEELASSPTDSLPLILRTMTEHINQLMVSQFNNFEDKFQKAMKEISTNSDENFKAVIKAINDRFDAIALGSQYSSLYGLPLPQLSTVKAPASWPEGVLYEFQTLPVDPKAVADGDIITVYVSTSDPFVSSSVPSKVNFLAAQRAEARQEKNYPEADYLHDIIIEAGYRVISIDNEDVLAKKIRIRLRGIDAPESQMPFGYEAQQELLKIVGGKSLKVLGYGTDQYERCLGDLHCDDGTFVQEEMLRNGLAWHYSVYDKREALAQLEKEARKKRIGLWASPNPEKPWDWRRKNRRDA